MTEKKKVERQYKIEFKLSEIKKLYHHERDLSEYGLTKKNIEKGGFETELKIKPEAWKNMVLIKIKTDYVHSKEKEKIRLFGIESLFKFEIKRFKQHFKTDRPGEYSIPNPIMVNFLNIALSGTRGMLAALNTNPAYGKIFFPLADPVKILKGFKKKIKSV